MLKVLITREKLLNIVDKTVLYQLPEGVLSNVLLISLIKITQKNFGPSIEMINMDEE